MKLGFFTTLLFALLVSLPVRAAKICNTDMLTLLRVHASRDFRPFPAHEPPYRIEEEYVVTRGGTAAVFRTSSRLGIAGNGRTVAFGRAKPTSLMTLLNALAATHVDEQASCVQVNNIQAFPVQVFGTYEVSWFGPDEQESSFQIAFADPGGSSLPACGVEATALVDAISAFADALAATPAARVCP